jgi:hypothetical protein
MKKISIRPDSLSDRIGLFFAGVDLKSAFSAEFQLQIPDLKVSRWSKGEYQAFIIEFTDKHGRTCTLHRPQSAFDDLSKDALLKHSFSLVPEVNSKIRAVASYFSNSVTLWMLFMMIFVVEVCRQTQSGLKTSTVLYAVLAVQILFPLLFWFVRKRFIREASGARVLTFESSILMLIAIFIVGTALTTAKGIERSTASAASTDLPIGNSK